MHFKIKQTTQCTQTLASIALALGLLLLWTTPAQAEGKSDADWAALPANVCTFLGLPRNCPYGPFANEPDPEPEPEPAAGESPVGLWHLVVDFPEMPPFLEIIVFHEGGTLSESNFSLHGNSANPMFPFNGGEGFGIWEIDEDGVTRFAFQKMVYDAENDNLPVGFLRVKGSAILDGGVWVDVESNTAILTPDGFVIADFGQADVMGRRLSLDDID